jgi:hypothetical protein
MAAPTAELIWDEKIAPAPAVREDERGVYGVCSFKVTTHMPLAALAAAPKRGTPWPVPDEGVSSLALPLVLQTKDTKYWARRNTAGPAPTSGGLTLVRCEYRAAINGRLTIPDRTTRFTELEYSTQTTQALFDINAVLGDPAFKPIHNGDGVARKVGLLSARVFAYFPASSGVGGPGGMPTLFRLATLMRTKALNEQPIELPKVDGIGTPVVLGVKQAQFEGFRTRLATGLGGQLLREVQYDLSLSDDFAEYWTITNERGEPWESHTAELYPAASFAGLW